MSCAGRPYGVLVADDSADDRLFLCKAIERVPTFKLLAEVENGRELIAYLQKKESCAVPGGHSFPDVLLLDLKMPQMDGIGVLKWLRLQPARPLYVVVLSGSFLDSDREHSAKLGANAFFTKSSSIPAIQKVLQEIQRILDRNSGLPLEAAELKEK